MKTIILNSGRGMRLRPLTRFLPKALLKINDKPLLGYQMNNLVECGLNEVIITTGPFENKIKKYLRKKFPQIKVSYVKNERYFDTNYIYSLWLTKNLIDDDVVLFHGDL